MAHMIRTPSVQKLEPKFTVNITINPSTECTFRVIVFMLGGERILPYEIHGETTLFPPQEL
jgi:hypothetical protein